MIYDQDLESLRSTPCEGVAQRLGLKVRMHKCRCPFHDDHTPSMTFKGTHWKCWAGCGSGDSIGLVRKMLGKNFEEACRWLADENNIIVSSSMFQDSSNHELLTMNREPFDASRYERFFERPWLNDEARRFLFDERRIDPRVVRWCRLTSWRDKQGVPWLQIPYYDREGKLVGIQNRNLVKGATPRFRFPTGSQCSLYNLPVLNLLKPSETLFITEGCSDCWAMLSAGSKAIAIPSATMLSKKDKEILLTLHSQLSTKFEMWPDNDAPGERLFLQLQEVLPSLVRHQLPVGCKDFSDYYVKIYVSDFKFQDNG